MYAYLYTGCVCIQAIHDFSEMNRRKKDLIETYVLHISVMSDIISTPNSLDLADVVSVEILQKSWREMLKFVDATDKSVSCTSS